MALFSYDNETTLPRMVEVAVDFNTGQPLMEANGGFRVVSGLEAVRVWVWRALQPDNVRFSYSAHTGSICLPDARCPRPRADWRAWCGRPCWCAPISRAWSGLSLPGKGRG